MDRCALTQALKDAAVGLGFHAVGVCAASRPAHYESLERWLDAGHHAEMTYLANHRAAREHPRHVLPDVSSLVVVALSYKTLEPTELPPDHGHVSRYAWGPDYHDVIRGKLRQLAERHRELAPGVCLRGVVDTAPLMERDFAAAAGVGQFGKNTMLLHRTLGSRLFLAVLLTSAQLVPDAPLEGDPCEGCNRCVAACPTGALRAPYRLDARRCISYWTIEHRGEIPGEVFSTLGRNAFGCDRCREVCPYDQEAPQGDATFAPGPSRCRPLDLVELFTLTDADFRSRFAGTSLLRPGRGGLLRNAAIALGNQPDWSDAARHALQRGVGDADEVVRRTCMAVLQRRGQSPNA